MPVTLSELVDQEVERRNEKSEGDRSVQISRKQVLADVIDGYSKIQGRELTPDSVIQEKDEYGIRAGIRDTIREAFSLKLSTLGE